jgi:N-methylhydantoinase A
LDADVQLFKRQFEEMKKTGLDLLSSEGTGADQAKCVYSLDLRYVSQYHEVNVEVSEDEVRSCDFAAMARRFHPLHDKLYGYSLEAEGAPVELLNMRLSTIGVTGKPSFLPTEFDGEDPGAAEKGKRNVYLPATQAFETIPVYDGFGLRFGNRVTGPAIIEQVNTTTFVTPEFCALCDRFGNYMVYRVDRQEEANERIWRWKK